MNPFIPTNCEFEILGYFEEFQDAETRKLLGTRPLEQPDRPCGSPGQRHYELPKSLQLSKGYKSEPVIVPEGKAVIATIQIKCGRTKSK